MISFVCLCLMGRYINMEYINLRSEVHVGVCFLLVLLVKFLEHNFIFMQTVLPPIHITCHSNGQCLFERQVIWIGGSIRFCD